MLPPGPPTTSQQQKPRQALTTASLIKPPSTTAAAAPSRQPSSRSVSNPVPMTSSLSNSRLQIFADPTGEEAESSTATAASTPWQDLGTRKTRIKENVPEVKKLVGTTLKQAGKSKRIASASASSSSKIAVYRDPGSEVMMPPPPSSLPTKVSTLTTATTTTGTRAEAPPKTPARSTFAPFVDSNPGHDDHNHVPPVTPRFTPFRDEVCVRVPYSKCLCF